MSFPQLQKLLQRTLFVEKAETPGRRSLLSQQAINRLTLGDLQRRSRLVIDLRRFLHVGKKDGISANSATRLQMPMQSRFTLRLRGF